MKRQVDKTGGKLWFNENLIDGFQDQLYKAIESQYKPFGSCIISGCEVSGSNIAEGIVYLDGKIMPFAGASGLSFPKYLKSQMTPVTAAYDDGHSDTTEEIYEAILSSTIPSGAYITLSAQGGKTFRQAFQDANNRMVSDAKINEWNASRGNAASDVRGGVGSAYNTLDKMYNWAAALFAKKAEKSGSTEQDFYTRKLEAQSTTGDDNFISVKCGHKSYKNTSIVAIGQRSSDGYMDLKRADGTVVITLIGSTGVGIFGGNVSALDATDLSHLTTLRQLNSVLTEALKKIDKSVMSSNISSTSTTNVATSKAVNDAKQNAISTASSDATTKADSAKLSAIGDIRAGVSPLYGTLDKMYNWAAALFANKADKSGSVEQDFYTRKLEAQGAVDDNYMSLKCGHASYRNTSIVAIGQRSSDGYMDLKRAAGDVTIEMRGNSGEVVVNDLIIR